MEEAQEYNIQTYELNQGGKDYILTTGLINDNIRITCRDHLELTGPYYLNDFSLSDLSSKNKYFILSDSIESAQTEINKAIERQKCGLKQEGNIIKIIIYLTIGTDQSNLNLSLLKQDGNYNQLKREAPQYIGKSNLENKWNYPQDEQRLNNLEQTNNGIRNSQNQLHQQLEQLIEESMKLINETYFLKEDNANRNLKFENDKLNKDTNILEQKLKNKQDNNIKDLEENNRRSQMAPKIDSSSGPVAKSTKFEKSQIQTFVSRPTMRPTGQMYQDNNNNDNSNENGPFKNFSVKHS